MKEPSIRRSLKHGKEDRSSTETSVNFYANKMDEEFIKAAKAGDLEKLKECLQNGVDVDIKNPGGLNALHLASRENHSKVVQYLLETGIDKKAITKRLNTALHIACLGGHIEIVQILIENGLPLNVPAQDDITPLYMAAQENHLQVVKLLLKHKADIHLAAKGGFEPSDIAALQGHTKVTMTLLEHDSKGLGPLHMAAKKDDTTALSLVLKESKNVNERISNGYTALHIACKHASINAANFLIDNGADINAPAKHNVAPLHVASRHGQVGVLKVLIEAGADLSTSTKDGLTALHCASRDGHDHCVELLVVHGAPLTAKTKHGLTALHMASQGNHRISANHLLSHGAHIDDLTLDGVTSLHVTAHYGKVETAKLLIEKGTDIDKRAKNGYTALHIASKKNREDVVRLLLKYKVSVHVKNNNGQTPLHVASFFGHVNIVLLLLQSGASLEATTVRDETVLHIACRTQQIQVVRLLLRNGAKINPKSKDEDTPLHNACRQGSASMVSLLLDHEADPNSINKEGCTPLHLACRDGDVKAVESILDHNGDVTIVSNRGFTPLHEASKKGHIPILKMLLDGKADVNSNGKNNLTPLHIACHYDQPDAAVVLLNREANPHAQAKNGFTPLHISSKKNQVQLVTLLLDRGVEADLTTRNGISPLHLAAQEGNLQIVDMLLDNGASPGVQTKNGLTPLHVAVHYNQLEVVKRLLKYGANINSATQSGFAPLHLAAMYGHYDVAELLLKDGAEVEPKTKNGNTPLHIASYHGHDDIVQLLLRYNAPPNALNKDGYSALYVAQVAEKPVVAETLTKVTKVAVKTKTGKNKGTDRSELVRRTFLVPEDLEETLLVDIGDEAEDEAHLQKKIIQEDFEESFAGLDESRPEQTATPSNTPQVQENEIDKVNEVKVESAGGNYEDFLNNLDNPNGEVLHSELNTNTESASQSETKESKNMSYPDNIYITQPPRQGKFLTCFYVDARGGTMESKQSGVKVVIPRGAVTMPTRIICSRDNHRSTLPSLHANESIASHVFKLAPGGEQFLKPVVLEIPHFAALCGSNRELIVLRCDSGSHHWKEHVSALIDDEQDGENDKSLKIKIIIQEIPDRLVIVSRPRKERFVMSSDGGTVQSSVTPQVKILFPSDTLNTSTKVVLQVQTCDDSLLQANDQTYVSPIVSLDPPTQLSKPITINIPCPWLNNEDQGNKRNIRLLSWLPRSPRKSTSDRSECEWQDITGKTALSIIGDIASFTTTEFTRYWLIQTNSVETLPKRAFKIEQAVSVAPFSVRFYVYGRINESNRGELRVFLVDDESAFITMISHYRNVVEIAKSPYINVYAKQPIHLKLSGNLTAADNQGWKLSYNPLRVNHLNIVTDMVSTDSVGRLTCIGSLRPTDRTSMAVLCNLDIQFTEEMFLKRKESLPPNTINDATIQLIGQSTMNSWSPLATELNLSKRDKQAVSDISSGKDDQPSIMLLKYWRAKNPLLATYKSLYDALKYADLDDEAEVVFNCSPVDISRELLPRNERAINRTPSPQLNGYPSLDSRKTKEQKNTSPSQTIGDSFTEPPPSHSSNLVTGKRKLMTIPSVSFDLVPTEIPPDQIPDEEDQEDAQYYNSNETPTVPYEKLVGEACVIVEDAPSDREKDLTNDEESDINSDGANVVAHADPLIDLSALNDFIEASDEEVDIPPPSTGPTAYELSLIRSEQHQKMSTPQNLSNVTNPVDKVQEDLLVISPVQEVHAEIDFEFLDQLDEPEVQNGFKADGESNERSPTPTDPGRVMEAHNGYRSISPLSTPDDELQNLNSSMEKNENSTENLHHYNSASPNGFLPDYSPASSATPVSPLESMSSPEVVRSNTESTERICSPDLVTLDSRYGEITTRTDEVYVSTESGDPMFVSQSEKTVTIATGHMTSQIIQSSSVVTMTSSNVISVSPEVENHTNETFEHSMSTENSLASTQIITKTIVTSEQQMVVNDKEMTFTSQTPSITSDENANTEDIQQDDKGEDLIKKMFSNQSSVMGFFDDNQGGEQQEEKQDDEDYSSYGTQV